MKDKGKAPEKSEGKITTPEEAAEITRQRRKKYGLGEKRTNIPEKINEINMTIKELLRRLYEYGYKSLSSEMQEEYYWVDQEANTGKDRELAKAVLEQFLNILKGESWVT